LSAIIRRMHRRLLLVLVAVLLLRGWAGEAMAGQMLAQQLQAAAVAQQVAAHPPDCPFAAAANNEAEAAVACSCLQCDDCSLNALVVPHLPHAEPLAAAPLASKPLAFASAEPVRGLKPPIS
jgi:hypothetical protein